MTQRHIIFQYFFGMAASPNQLDTPIFSQNKLDLFLFDLFVAMLLENVTIALTTEKSAIQSQHTDAFKNIWDDYIIDPQIQSKKSSTGKDMLNCYDLIKLIKTLDEPLGRIDELDNWEHRLLLELKVGLQVSRRHTYVSFENALMGICVLYLSNACLPYV